MSNLLSTLKDYGNRSKKRVGRGPGSKLGKTCGRGHKGYKARSGSKTRIRYEGGQMPLFKKLPTRGFDRAKFDDLTVTVTLADIDRFCSEGESFDPSTLVKVKRLGKSKATISKYQLFGRKDEDSLQDPRKNEKKKAAKSHEPDFSKVNFRLKVIDSGELTKKVAISAHSFSKGAMKKLEEKGIVPTVIGEKTS